VYVKENFTSATCHECGTRLVPHLGPAILREQAEGAAYRIPVRRQVPLWDLKQCPAHQVCGGTWDRNENAALNIDLAFTSMMQSVAAGSEAVRALHLTAGHYYTRDAIVNFEEAQRAQAGARRAKNAALKDADAARTKKRADKHAVRRATAERLQRLGAP
jgi:hypothetical protein